ncbi:PAS domain-containing protein, partial [Streptomyces sp. 13-12-16]|uniref:PAS domain-containing protein n=1 Tax=Streptomyces sp. 13-12-16 TaxID=1570823 RepID=UPI00117BF9DC
MDDASAAMVVDARGIVTGWSEGARRLTGHPAEEAVGRAARALLAGDAPSGTAPLPPGPVTLRHRDGHPVPVRLTVRPLLGAGGAPAGHLITAEPPDETRVSLAAWAFQQAPLGVSVVGPDLRYLLVNDTACRLLGEPQENLVGRSCLEPVEEEYTRGLGGHLRRVAETGEALHYEMYSRAPTQPHPRAWNMEMWPVAGPSGESVGTALAAFDTTEQHRARRRLALLNEAATAIGTTLDVVRTAEELVALMVPAVADFVAVDLHDWVLGADEPPVRPDTGVVLRRVAHGSAAEGAPEAVVRLGQTDVYPPSSPPARALRECEAVLARAGEPDFDRWVA